MAHSDPLTGLLNRRGFDDALVGALGRATPERILALYVLDLDAFKPVNDQFGHHVGDELLRVVAQRLRASVRSRDAVARLGGDEFVVMADGLANEALARELGLKLLDAFRAPFALGAHTCSVSATVGYALAPAPGAQRNAGLIPGPSCIRASALCAAPTATIIGRNSMRISHHSRPAFPGVLPLLFESKASPPTKVKN